MATKESARGPRKRSGTENVSEATPRRREPTSYPGADGSVRIVGAPDFDQGADQADEDGLQWLSWADVKPQKYEWFFPNRLAFGTLALLEGRQKSGKGTLTIALAAALTGGPKLPGGRKEKPAPVFWLGVEESIAKALRPRLEAAGGNPHLLSSPAAADGRSARRLVLPGDFDNLESAIRRRRPRLIVMDPLSSCVAIGVNLSDEQQTRAVLEPVAMLAERYNLLVLMIRHFRKARVGNALEQGLGGTAISAVARMVLRIDKDPDTPGARLLACAGTNNESVPATLRFHIQDKGGYGVVKWAGTSELTAEELAAEAGDQGEQDARADARAFLKDALKEGMRSVEDLEKGAEQAGVSRGTLRRAKTDLHVQSVAKGSKANRVWYWRMPPQDK